MKRIGLMILGAMAIATGMRGQSVGYEPQIAVPEYESLGVGAPSNRSDYGLKYEILDKKKHRAALVKAENAKGTVHVPSAETIDGAVYSVYSIGELAFAGCSELRNITLPNTLEIIEEGAFENCVNLRSIYIPVSLGGIGIDAFIGCDGLERVVISDLDEWCRLGFHIFEGESSNPLQHAHHLYLNNRKITKVIFPNDITRIGPSVFDGGSDITEIIIPYSVTEIGEAAFRGCSSLKEIKLPASVTTIGDWAFFGCAALTDVEIPTSVTEIREGAFSQCNALTSIVIPNSVEEIGDWAFSGCENLRKAVLPKRFQEKVGIIFEDSRSLTDITFSE